MKKQSSNKINLPKKKRFSRFFLRRLLICTAARGRRTCPERAAHEHV